MFYQGAKLAFFYFMKLILGKKMAMTQIWQDDNVIAVTPVLAGPCFISQIKNLEKDKYQALQVAYGQRKLKNIKKPQVGHFKKANCQPMHVREFRVDNVENIKLGQEIDVASFSAGDIVKVSGVSKGKGFQGVVKRHKFAGGNKSHGNKDQLRMPGSIGSLGPAHVFKGVRMPGRMGGEKVSILNLKIAKVDSENKIIYIEGAIPGAINGLIRIVSPGELKFIEAKQEEKVEEKKVVEEKTEKVEEKEVKKEEKNNQ